MNVYSLANSISPQRIFIVPRKPRMPKNRGSDPKKGNGVLVRITYAEKMRKKKPVAAIT